MSVSLETNMHPYITREELTIECADSILVNKLLLTCYQFDNAIYERLLRYLRNNPRLTHLRFTKSCLTKDQVNSMLMLVNGTLKGVKLQDECGMPFGSCYTDWHWYNDEKKDISELRETTLEALKLFPNLPKRVMDFGASNGQETIPLIEMGCPYVIAIDGDEEALETLANRYSRLKKDTPSKLIVYRGAFTEYKLDQPVDLFICSLTWPYRPEKDFPACWKKTKECVAVGGVIAGHFFGPPQKKKSNPVGAVSSTAKAKVFEEPELVLDKGMTYHTEVEVKALLAPDFEILFFKKTKKLKIYGGKIPPWGMLYQVVARRR